MASSDSDSDSASYFDSDDDPTPAIFEAVLAFDVEALQRELAAGVDPNLLNPLADLSLMYYALRWNSSSLTVTEDDIQDRLACISVLLEAGARIIAPHDPDGFDGMTPLHLAVGVTSPAYQAVIAFLIKSGADVNATTPLGSRSISVLAEAAACGTAATVRRLISAGAVDFDGALRAAIENGKHRNCAPLLRAGAVRPARYTARGPGHEPRGYSETCDYMRKIRAAGGYKKYEHAHRQRLVAMFAPKFPHLPADMLGRVLEFVFDVGGH